MLDILYCFKGFSEPMEPIHSHLPSPGTSLTLRYHWPTYPPEATTHGYNPPSITTTTHLYIVIKTSRLLLLAFRSLCQSTLVLMSFPKWFRHNLKSVLHIQFQCVGRRVVVSPAPPASDSDTRCPTIQLSPDTIQRGHQIPQVKGSVLSGCPPLHVPVASLHYCLWF